MEKNESSRVFKDEDVAYELPSGVKVMKTKPPSPEACVRFWKVIQEIKAKYDIK